MLPRNYCIKSTPIVNKTLSYLFYNQSSNKLLGDLMYIIIGAGPAGLYTAIKLKKEGVDDLIVLDPRAGDYTRPGHLNINVFRSAEIGIDESFWPGDKVGHIKDLERHLYTIALRLGIKIEKKRFIEIKPKDASSQAQIIVADAEGKEELIDCEYVFDCTGSRRVVINAVNDISASKPFKLEKITEFRVANHFIAYVNIGDESKWVELARNLALYWLNFEISLEIMGPLHIAESLIKLREFGWNELRFPHCYGAYFGKGKVCLYLYTPKNLAPEHYDLWVKTVLECYGSPINYTHLPPSRKPRFVAFKSEAKALQRVAFCREDLPTIIALGDTQIDSHHQLAHGISDGMKRIEALFEHMVVAETKIRYFNPDEYLFKIRTLLLQHKEDIQAAAEEMESNFIEALMPVQKILESAYILSKDGKQKENIAKILSETEGRISYIRAKNIFNEYHDVEYILKTFPAEHLLDIMSNLTTLKDYLFEALTSLPEDFIVERDDVKYLLVKLGESMIKIGIDLFKANNIPQAIIAFKNATAIYDAPSLSRSLKIKHVIAYSNLAFIYKVQKDYDKTISANERVLEIYLSYNGAYKKSGVIEKIIYNLIMALCAKAKELILHRIEDSIALYQKAKALTITHETIFTVNYLPLIEKEMTELSNLIESSHNPVIVSPTPSDPRLSPESKEDSAEADARKLVVGMSLFKPLLTNDPDIDAKAIKVMHH